MSYRKQTGKILVRAALKHVPTWMYRQPVKISQVVDALYPTHFPADTTRQQVRNWIDDVFNEDGVATLTTPNKQKHREYLLKNGNTPTTARENLEGYTSNIDMRLAIVERELKELREQPSRPTLTTSQQLGYDVPEFVTMLREKVLRSISTANLASAADWLSWTLNHPDARFGLNKGTVRLWLPLHTIAPPLAKVLTGGNDHEYTRQLSVTRERHAELTELVGRGQTRITPEQILTAWK